MNALSEDFYKINAEALTENNSIFDTKIIYQYEYDEKPRSVKNYEFHLYSQTTENGNWITRIGLESRNEFGFFEKFNTFKTIISSKKPTTKQYQKYFNKFIHNFAVRNRPHCI